MKKQTRRKFLAAAGVLGGGMAASAMPLGNCSALWEKVIVYDSLI